MAIWRRMGRRYGYTTSGRSKRYRLSLSILTLLALLGAFALGILSPGLRAGSNYQTFLPLVYKSSPRNIPEGWQWYENTKWGFGFAHPPLDYALDPQADEVAVLLHLYSSPMSLGVLPNPSRYSPKDWALAKLAEWEAASAKGDAPAVRVLNRATIVVNEQIGYELLATEYDRIGKHVFLSSGEQAMEVTFPSTVNPDDPYAEAHYPTFENILESLRWMAPVAATRAVTPEGRRPDASPASRWAAATLLNVPYADQTKFNVGFGDPGNGCTIARDGCYLVSMWMLYKYYGDTKYATPGDLANNIAWPRGPCVWPGGTPGAPAGVSYRGQIGNSDFGNGGISDATRNAIDSELDSRRPVLAHVWGAYTDPKWGHWVVITGRDSTYYMNDPYGKTRDRKDVPLSQGGLGSYRISEVKLFSGPVPGAPPTPEPPRDSPPPVNAPEGVTVYENANYGGASRAFTSDVPSLRAYAFNDVASSIKIVGSYKAVLYNDDNYAGTSEELGGDDAFLGDNQIGNDSLSSIRVMREGSGGQQPPPTPVPLPEPRIDDLSFNPESRAEAGSNVTVRARASATGGSIGGMRLYVDGVLKSEAGGGDASWQWDTAGLAVGQHTVAVVARESGDSSWSRPARRDASYSIVDSIAPTNPTSITEINGISDGRWQNSVRQPSFRWSGATDGGAGVDGYLYYWGTDPAGISTSFSGAAALTAPASVGETEVATYYLRVATRDAAGNTAPWVTLFTLRYDGAPPAGSLSINRGITETTTVAVVLAPNATDTGSGLADMRFSNNGTDWGPWITYATSADWTILPTNGSTTAVNAQFRDQVGNASAPVTATIALNIYPNKPSSAQYRITTDSIGMAGGSGTSSSYNLLQAVGQAPVPGAGQSDNFRLTGGFAAAQAAIPSVNPVATRKYIIKLDLIAASGGQSASANFTVKGSTGEPLADGTLSSSGFRLRPGFWSGGW